MNAGVYFGPDLIDTNDNVWFTVLFKRPAWYAKAGRNEIFNGLGVFQKAMCGDQNYSLADALFLTKAAFDIAQNGIEPNRTFAGLWPFKRAAKMILHTTSKSPWGWKEPNTHILLEHVMSYFPSLKYIHVMRNGLDMAYSGNQQQLLMWAHLYGIDRPNSEAELPKKSLLYWLRANQRIIGLAEELGSERILIVRYDDLCADPVAGIKEILHFLNLDWANVETLAQVVQPSASSGRHRNMDLTMFADEELESVRRLGFKVMTD